MRFELRYVDRSCYCRVCNKNVPRNSEKMFAFYNLSRQGGNDFICKECIKQMNDYVENE